MILILNKKYNPEAFVDMMEEIEDAMSNIDVPTDDDGFAQGVYSVRIEFIKPEDEAVVGTND